MSRTDFWDTHSGGARRAGGGSADAATAVDEPRDRRHPQRAWVLSLAGLLNNTQDDPTFRDLLINTSLLGL